MWHSYIVIVLAITHARLLLFIRCCKGQHQCLETTTNTLSYLTQKNETFWKLSCILFEVVSNQILILRANRNLSAYTPKNYAWKFSKSCINRVKNDSDYIIAIFTNTSIFLLWLGEITHMHNIQNWFLCWHHKLKLFVLSTMKPKHWIFFFQVIKGVV